MLYLMQHIYKRLDSKDHWVWTLLCRISWHSWQLIDIYYLSQCKIELVASKMTTVCCLNHYLAFYSFQYVQCYSVRFDLIIKLLICFLSDLSIYMYVFMSVCRCNGEVELGSKALDDVLYRAQLELFPEALLVGAIILFSANITFPSTLCGFGPVV